MKSHRRRAILSLLLLPAAGLLLVPSPPSPAVGPPKPAGAAALLVRAGVSEGLVVHVGTTDGALEAGLAARPALAVLGVAHDAATGEKARALLAGKSLLGRAVAL